jgi:hypothetical protein
MSLARLPRSERFCWLGAFGVVSGTYLAVLLREVQQARRAQFRFRRDPDAYLVALENKFLQLRLLP